MSYCGEVSEQDWCRFHACMRNRCRWQHEETFEQMQMRVGKARDEQLAATRKQRYMTTYAAGEGEPTRTGPSPAHPPATPEQYRHAILRLANEWEADANGMERYLMSDSIRGESHVAAIQAEVDFTRDSVRALRDLVQELS